MKCLPLLRSSFFLSINRSFIQIGSIVTLSILGHYNIEILASYTILFSTIAIFITLATSGQSGLQSAFARLHDKKIESIAFLENALVSSSAFSFLLCLILLCVGATNLIKGNDVIFEVARDSFSWFILSIPLLTMNNVLAMFMGANGLAKMVSKSKICLVTSEVACVAVLAIFSQLSLFKIIVIVIASDLIGLITLTVFCCRYHLFSIYDLNFRSIGIRQISTITQISLPTTLSQIFMAYIGFIIITTAAAYGTISVIVLSTINSLAFLIKIPVIGISQQVGLEVAKQPQRQSILANIRVGSMIIFLLFVLLLYCYCMVIPY